MALIWMKLAPVRKGTQARMRRVSCQLWMKATMIAIPREHTVLVAKPNLEPAAWWRDGREYEEHGVCLG